MVGAAVGLGQRHSFMLPRRLSLSLAHGRRSMLKHEPYGPGSHNYRQEKQQHIKRYASG